MNGATVKAYLDAKKTDVDIFKNKDAAFENLGHMGGRLGCHAHF